MAGRGNRALKISIPQPKVNIHGAAANHHSIESAIMIQVA